MMVFSFALLGFLLMTEKYESREKIGVPVLEPGFLLYLLSTSQNGKNQEIISIGTLMSPMS